MRKMFAAALLVAMAWPAGAVESPDQMGAADLLQAVRADRAAVDVLPGRSAKAAARLLKKSERMLAKLVTRFEVDPALDSKALALFAKSGRWITAASDTGALASGSPSVTGWNAMFDAVLLAADDVVTRVTVECDRVVISTSREKVARKLDAAIIKLALAAQHDDPVDHARDAARALRNVERALAKAERFCAREANVNTPRGITAHADLLASNRRDDLIVSDLRWDVSVSTLEGQFVNRDAGRLSAPSLSHLALIPIRLERGDSLSAFELARIYGLAGRRVDGYVTWTTNRGTFHVPVHLGR